MRSSLAALAVIAPLALTIDPAFARVDVDPATGRVTCAALYGQYGRRPVEILAEGGRLAGRVRLVAAAAGDRWAPAAGFVFRGATRHNAGAQIVLMPENRNALVVGLRVPGESSLVELGEWPLDRWVPLSVAISDRGLLTVMIGDRTFRRNVRLERPLRPVILCNSGTFEFDLAPGMRLAEPSPED